MTTKYDRETALRLADEARSDDERMTKAPWRCNEPNLSIDGDLGHRDGPVIVAEICGEAMSADGTGITRNRNNLRSVAEQLAAAVTRIDELEAEKETR